MKYKTEKILVFLHVLAWVAMIGYAINCGRQIISFAGSVLNSAAPGRIPGADQHVSNLQQYNFWLYVFAMSFVVALSGMFVYLWHLVIKLLSKLNIQNPFTIEVSKKLEKVAWWLFAIWAVGLIGEKYVDWLSKKIEEPLNLINAPTEFLFAAGIVYIVSQIFKRGIEIQEENQQTI